MIHVINILQENTDLNGLIKHELVEKYKNALPHDISESTFGKFEIFSLPSFSYATFDIKTH